MVRVIIGFIMLLIAGSTAGQYNYDFNERCRKAYAEIISLKFDTGKILIEEEKKLHPDNNIPYLLDNYIYFLTAFIGENEEEFDELEDRKDEVIDRLEDGDQTSPYYRYCLAQVYLQWAVSRTKFKE